MQEEKITLLNILSNLMKINKTDILHTDEYSFIALDEKIFDKIKKDFTNDISFLNIAKLFLELNTKESIIQAFLIAIRTTTNEYKTQRLTIHKILESINNSLDFSEEEKQNFTLASFKKCNECLAKEEENE